MQLDQLNAIIRASGGQGFALEYAGALLDKISRLETAKGYESLMTQLRDAKEQGDLRGRVLEVNFAHVFAENGIELEYGAKQGMAGDVDFCWPLSGHRVFIEMKLLGEDKRTKESVKQQLQETGFSSTLITDDTRDVARIQRDIFAKSSTKKFNPRPDAAWVNLVAVDVSELQLGTVDVGECLLAAVGNEGAARYCHPLCLRPTIVGVFELADMGSLRAEQIEWIKRFHALPAFHPHPREYIHGVLFLFREPKERAALSYQMTAALVWNPTLMDEGRARHIAESLHRVIPCVGATPSDAS